ncbi:hypothetical protein EW146_g4184 [Bondarzewia mesenterica]|uniref:Uncharacterized protein n=1 Tax=Bondarzewia mesenterica TaxID=1095465 RepID=A0A4S4LV96_9AGAM|nr:hypothetical protein EW146_g4184 [Bondarzewia mesenterica]
MSQSLSSFNPFAEHPFTNVKKATIPIPPSPSQYPRHIPSSRAVAHRVHLSPSSLPSTQTPIHLAAPQPQYPSPAPPHPSSASNRVEQGIFVTFTPERRSTPDLEDIFVQKDVANVESEVRWSGDGARRSSVFIYPYNSPITVF